MVRRHGCVAKISLRRESSSSALRSGGDLEKAGDEFRLPSCIITAQSFDLTLVEHVHRFNPFESPLRSMEGAETLHRPPPPSDEAVVLFDSPFAND